MIDIKITGLAELNRTLRALPQAIQTRVLKGMVSTGAAIIRNEAILRAPVYTGKVQAGHPPPGTLKAAIYQTRLVADCTDTREVWKVDVRKGKFIGKGASRRLNRTDAYYASWVEYGTVKMSAKPFMRPAFEAKKQAAVSAMGTYLAFRLPDAVEWAKKAAR